MGSKWAELPEKTTNGLGWVGRKVVENNVCTMRMGWAGLKPAQSAHCPTLEEERSLNSRILQMMNSKQLSEVGSKTPNIQKMFDEETTLHQQVRNKPQISENVQKLEILKETGLNDTEVDQCVLQLRDRWLGARDDVTASALPVLLTYLTDLPPNTEFVLGLRHATGSHWSSPGTAESGVVSE